MLLALLSACAPDEEAATEFVAGSFQFTTTGVNDQCNDGAFDTVFMPEGTPEDFENAIELPGTADLPSTYTIDLQDPFGSMEVTVVAGETEGQLVVEGAVQTGVELDADRWPECTVDSVIDIYLTIVTDNELTGSAILHTENYTGDNCPDVTSDPCDVALDLKAVRL